MDSSLSRPTGQSCLSVTSEKARAAVRWMSTVSEKESVVSAERRRAENRRESWLLSGL
jgi:hypothetical protein